MPAPESFAAIVDTLASVRRDYHEKLKSIPQYEAFLLIEDSTNKAAGALHGTEGSSIATDVIDSLQYARTRFEQHMTSIPQYRVLVAIDKVIKEISQHLGLAAHDDATAPPSAAADHAGAETAAVSADVACETASPEPIAAEVEQDAAEDEPAEAEIAEEPASEPAEAEAEVEAEAEAPALRVVEAKAPSIVPADADASHDDDIVVLNAPAWEKSGKDAKDDITARLAAKAASAALTQADDSHEETDDLVVVSTREPSDHEAA
ncbi:conserved hypothetical protein [Bradyrhizobium sp. ORS 375]|uniref:hypothetical protein n=1 Tax=Bradyrhizobium sp. (strain ORS 375) TaxID=566679 RepID=UPI0002407AC5|nr:hypothetical protein [Bradyrhizobium sp. ORS 375]CCD95451.1 conserved hypothetical protein [Bradyrhizobium sp. ORS 375]